MNIPENISQHLKFISENGDLFAGILKGEKKEFLHHPFWNFDQIENSLEIREEWNIEESMIPFYGDWHDLIVITEEEKVIELNDQREITYQWESFERFKKSLIEEKDWKDEPSADDDGIISATFDF